jgi:hypothetical protein
VNRFQTVVSPPRGYSARPAAETDAEMIYRVVYDYDVSIVGYSDFAKDDLLASSGRSISISSATPAW